MNQPSSPMTSAPKSNLKMLIIVLTIVVLASAGFYYFYVLKSSNSTPTTSPTANVSALSSPSSSISPTAPASSSSSPATSSSSKTTSPSPVLTTPPEGWKIDKNSSYLGRDVAGGANYQVFIKNEWTVADGGDPEYPKSNIVYGDNSNCKWSSDFDPSKSCLFSVGVSKSSSAQNAEYPYSYRSFPAGTSQYGNPIYLWVTFYSSKLTASDKETILNSFQITK